MKSLLAVAVALVLATSLTWAAQPPGVGGKNPDSYKPNAKGSGLSDKGNTQITSLLERHLPGIRFGKGKKRFEALHELSQEMQRLSHSGIHPEKGTRESFSADVLAVLKDLRDNDPEDIRTKRLMVEFVARFGAGQSAQDFILNMLKSGDVRLRKNALLGLRNPHIELEKPELYQEIAELEASGTIASGEAYRTLRWLEPVRARGEMLQRAHKTESRQEFMQMAWILQSYEDPHVLSELLPRVGELRLDRPNGQGKTSLYWIDHKLFAQYLRTVGDGALLSSVELLSKGGGSIITVAPVLIERDLINHQDPQIRRQVAILIRKAAGDENLPYARSQELLQSRLAIERDATVKKELLDQLDMLASIKRHYEQLQKRLGR